MYLTLPPPPPLCVPAEAGALLALSRFTPPPSADVNVAPASKPPYFLGGSSDILRVE